MLHRECARAQRTMLPVSLMMIDVDNFKQLNDTNGHQAGDTYLIRVANALRNALPRVTDFVARYGGDEFAAILPATDAAGAAEAARKVCLSVADPRSEDAAPPVAIVTVSVGISTYDGSPRRSAEHLVHAADKALYDAKQHGRNCFQRFPIDTVKTGDVPQDTAQTKSAFYLADADQATAVSGSDATVKRDRAAA